jgi:hypothetical protein
MLDRVINIAAVAAFVCLVTGFGYAVWDASQHQQNQHPPREQHTNNEQTHPDKRPEKSATVQINCDPNCAADNSDDNRNVVSQFLHKLANDPLSIVTLLLVGVVVVQVRDGRRSSERQLRAYVVIKTVMFYRPNTGDGDEQEWPIHLVFRNAGQTPAYATVITAESYLGSGKPKDEIFALSKAAETSQPSIMGPAASHTMRLGGLEPGHAKFLAAQKAEMYCYVWGRVDYIDTFGRDHFTKFQMWQNFTGVQQFGFCEVGNATDDEFPKWWWRKLTRRWQGKRGHYHAREQG